MQKTTSVVLGALMVLGTALVVWRSGPGRPRPTMLMIPSAASALALSAPSLAEPIPALSLTPPSPLQLDLAPGLPGTVLLDGTVPPPLAASAPAELTFGVVLVQYRGAQRAPMKSRSKAEALELAKALAKLAQKDFKAAVDKGDLGSMERAGSIPRGVLEPAPNYVLFSLPPGEVGGPVDTPTGYWVMKNWGK